MTLMESQNQRFALNFFSAAQNIFYAYPALRGRQVCCGFLQSIASSR
jgi:hypothetical protein